MEGGGSAAALLCHLPFVTVIEEDDLITVEVLIIHGRWTARNPARSGTLIATAS
jgi:hypothetical protein